MHTHRYATQPQDDTRRIALFCLITGVIGLPLTFIVIGLPLAMAAIVSGHVALSRGYRDSAVRAGLAFGYASLIGVPAFVWLVA